MRTNRIALAALVCAAAGLYGCISVDSNLLDAAEGCDEFQAGASLDGDVEVDASVRLFVEASAELHGVTREMKGAVREACANIALDLGAQDSWSALGDDDDSISNGSGTGACDVARVHIEQVMQTAVAAEANFALVVSRGRCWMDFDMQRECEQQCWMQQTCEPGDVVQRCEPGELSVVCEGSCNAGAYCQGNMEVAANCMGVCESTCQGECKGSCVADDGSVTENDPNCHGKCSAACNGTCRGLCKVEAEAGIECGASVTCKGGCTGEYSEPKCESIFLPPTCTVDQKCQEACDCKVVAHRVCEPAQLQLTGDITIMGDAGATLKATLEANLPKLLDAAEVQGRLALEAMDSITVAGEAVAEGSGDLSGKSLACAAAATHASVEVAATLRVVIEASAAVVDTCDDHAD
jgi:hypothetical protein